MKFKIIFAFISMIIASSVNAEFIRDGEIYAGLAGYTHDAERGLEDVLSFEAGFERPINPDLSWDFWFSRYETDSSVGGADNEVKRLSQGLLYHLNQGNVRAFVNAGFGHQKNSVSGGAKIKETAIHLGLGVKAYQDTNYIMRAELLTLYSADHEMTDLGARLTLGYSFGREFIREVPVPEPEPEPIPEPEPEPEPTDEDLDGVYDDADLCPGTDPSHRVDGTGCTVMLTELISINMDIKFEADSAELSLDFYPEVKKLADVMMQEGNTTLTVEGHTDYQGSRAYNQRLSQRRAESVRRVLLEEFGLAENRVIARGFGEDQPVADNTTEEGRAINRRVIAVIDTQITKPALR